MRKVETVFLREGDLSISELVVRGHLTDDLLPCLLDEIGYNIRMDEKFYFVGLIETTNKIFIFFPKIFDVSKMDAKNSASLLKLLQLITQKRNNSIQAETTLSASKAAVTSKRLKLAHRIMANARDHGLLKFDAPVISHKERGVTNWAVTIAKQTPTHSTDGPIYLSPYLQHRSEDIDREIEKIHLYILKECFDRYGGILNFNARDLSMLRNQYYENILPNAQSKLRGKLRETYDSRKQSTLKDCIDWLNLKTGDRLAVYGTRQFHIAWEMLCVNLLENFSNHPVFSALTRPPIWTTKTGLAFPGAGKFRFDMVWKDQGAKLLILADAKYYKLYLDETGIVNAPGVNDISKQAHYHELIRKAQESVLLDEWSNYTLENVFLLPGIHQTSFATLFGTVIIPGINMQPIKVVSVDYDSTVELYMRSMPADASRITSVLTNS